MAVSEQSRHELYRRLEETLGAEAAATLMEHLPPVGWADVATKRDLDALRQDFGVLAHDFDGLRHDLVGFEQRLKAEVRADIYQAINAAITSQTRTIVFALIGSNMTVAALAFVAGSVR